MISINRRLILVRDFQYLMYIYYNLNDVDFSYIIFMISFFFNGNLNNIMFLCDTFFLEIKQIFSISVYFYLNKNNVLKSFKKLKLNISRKIMKKKIYCFNVINLFFK